MIPASPDSLPVDPVDPVDPADPVEPVEPPVGPVKPPNPSALPSGPSPLPVAGVEFVDGFEPPDEPVEPPDGPDVFLGPMLKLLTGPSPLLLLDPVPLPVEVVREPVWVVVVEWRVIDVADSCIGLSAIGAVGVLYGLPGALGPWCVLAAAVAAVPNAVHIAVAVIAPLITTVRVHDRWMLCLPTTSPLRNKKSSCAAQVLERLFTVLQRFSPKRSESYR